MGFTGWLRHVGHMESSGRVASIDQARKQARTRKATRLTEIERQLLLDEVAAISAELCDLQVWAAGITRRVTTLARDTRADRSA
jgi:hypothetical protein